MKKTTQELREIVRRMRTADKAALCCGLDAWRTVPFEEYGIPSITMSDGPHGLRKKTEDSDAFGLDSGIASTCFPTAVTLACSWDRQLLETVGSTIAEECLAEDVQILLGPGANIKRSPLCGRNFEYFSEDPYLSSQMALSHIRGVQSKGVGSSLKHFVANNQETRRLTINAKIDERTLREIYLASFEDAVKQGKPATVMCSYNTLNGVMCSANKRTLTDILRTEWGFEGVVVSDWGAVNERVDALEAGLDIEMPSSGKLGPNKIIAAHRSGKLRTEVLDRAVMRLLKMIFELDEQRQKGAVYDADAHHECAAEALRQSAVLLKNEGGVLPLEKSNCSIAVIGAMAKKPRIQGAGSSQVTPLRVDSIFDALRAAAPDAYITYSEGYGTGVCDADEELIAAAVQKAQRAQVALIFAGLPEEIEAEGCDRSNMLMPQSHTKLIEAVAAAQPNTVVVFIGGSPVEMNWIANVRGLLCSYLGGEGIGSALADLIFGNVSPSGRLAETMPVCLENNPSYLNFPGDITSVNYAEGVMVGYRHYLTYAIKPNFSFGYGLSYTTFEYSNLTADKSQMKDLDTLTVSVTVENTGSMAAREVVQLYVAPPTKCPVVRPVRELRAFDKVLLAPGEKKTVTFTLTKRAFAYYDVDVCDWRASSGEYTLQIGRACDDIILSLPVTVEDTLPQKEKERIVFHRNSTIEELQQDELGRLMLDMLLTQVRQDPNLATLLGGEELSPMVLQIPLRSAFSMYLKPDNDKMLNMLISVLNSNTRRKIAINKLRKIQKKNAKKA